MVFKSRFDDETPDARYEDLLSLYYWNQLDVFKTNTLFVDFVSGREWTGAQIKRQTDQIARNLIEHFDESHKLAPFDVVSFYYNCDYLHLISLAVLFAGGSFCAGAPEDPEREHAHMLDLMRPSMVLCPHHLVGSLLRLRCKPQNYHLIVMDDDKLDKDQFERLSLDLDSGAGAGEQQKVKILGFHRHFLERQPSESTAKIELPIRVAPTRPAYVLLTSGSTGKPKPVGRSQRNSIYVCHSFNGLAGRQLWHLDQRSVLAGHLQLDHGTGTFCIKMTLAKGLKLIIMHGYEFNLMFDAIKRYKITDICLGSALLHNFIGAIMDSLKSDTQIESSLSSLRNFLAVGSPIASQSLVDAFMDRFSSCSIRQAYGMTECGFTAVNEAQRSAANIQVDGSKPVGRLLPNLEIKLMARNDHDESMPNESEPVEITEFGREGELYIRGPTVSQGYLGARFEEQSRACFLPDGFYKTNDICQVLDDQIHLQIRGRFSEILCLHDGWKVLPSEIEQLLVAHPLIKEAAVIGVPHPNLPTCHAVRAYVVPKDGVPADFDQSEASDQQADQSETKQEFDNATGRLTKKLVFDYAASHLSEPKQLTGGIKIMRQLPRISIGKVDKKLLRKNDGYL